MALAFATCSEPGRGDAYWAPERMAGRACSSSKPCPLPPGSFARMSNVCRGAPAASSPSQTGGELSVLLMGPRAGRRGYVLVAAGHGTSMPPVGAAIDRLDVPPDRSARWGLADGPAITRRTRDTAKRARRGRRPPGALWRSATARGAVRVCFLAKRAWRAADGRHLPIHADVAQGMDHALQDPERHQPFGLGHAAQHPDLDGPDRNRRLG
jgi:hypothetical protein